MVWKNGKFGRNTGNTLRRSPWLEFGRKYHGTICRTGYVDMGDEIIEKLSQCISNSTSEEIGFYESETLITSVGMLLSLFENNVVYSLDKQQRWEFVEIIETELMRLKGIEDAVHNHLGGEDPFYELDQHHYQEPTSVVISLEHVSQNDVRNSMLTFQTIPEEDHKVDEGDVKYRKVCRGLQRTDQCRRVVPMEK